MSFISKKNGTLRLCLNCINLNVDPEIDSYMASRIDYSIKPLKEATNFFDIKHF